MNANNAIDPAADIAYVIWMNGLTEIVYFAKQAGARHKMLTLNAILKATKQMTSYGESGMRGTMGQLSGRVQEQPKSGDIDLCADNNSSKGISGRRWDNELKTWRFD